MIMGSEMVFKSRKNVNEYRIDGDRIVVRFEIDEDTLGLIAPPISTY